MVVANTKFSRIWKINTIFVLFLLFINQAWGQTPGLIFKKSTAATPQVLDPNGDGYVSKTTAGFSGTDVGSTASEIPYRSLPLFGSEPLGDISTGANGGQTDLAQPPWGMYFDDKGNILCRVRVGSTSTASKGFSILLDTDNTFATPANPTNPTGYAAANPGFEFELLLATNFNVRLIDHRPVNGVASSIIVFNGDVNQYSQRSVALTRNGDDADYFYDFYIPLSAFNGAITASTPLRMSGTTITSAQSGISGTAADVGGVDDRLYGNNPQTIWRNVINSFPPTTLSQLQAGEFCRGTPTAPVLNNPPIRVNATSFTGTSSEIGGIVKLYKAASASATPTEIISTTTVTVASDRTWSFPVPSGTTLAAGEVITAKIFYANTAGCAEVYSPASNAVTVANLQAGTCTTTAPSSIALESGSKTLLITSAYAGLTTSTLKIYRDGVVFTGTVAPVSTTSPYTYRFTPSNSCTQFAFSYDCSSTGKGSGASSYVTLSATATVNGCESPRSTQYYLTGNTLNPTPNATTTATPTISTSNICPSTITITGTSVANALIYLFSNGQSVRSDANGGIISVATANGNGVWSIDMSLYGFTLNDVVTVKAKEPGDPATYSSGFKGLSAPSNGVTIGSTCGVPSMAPAITGNYCTSTSIISVTGTSSEAAGTTITIYKTGVSTALATATVSSAGYWTATIPANQLTGGSTFYATATAPNKTVSSNSTTTSVSSKPSGSAITINAVTEGATSITGFITGTVTNPSTIRIYIDGTPISQTATVAAAGNWTVSGIPASEVAAGLRVTATIAANANTGCLESDPSTAVTISCTPPSTTIPSTTLTSANTFCSNGAAKISVANSENGVVYEMYNVNTNMVSGSSVLGTGGTIILTSADLTSSATLTVRAYKIGASCGNVTIANSTYSITVNFPPTVFNVSPSTQSTCNGGTATLTLSGSQSGVNYQLYNGSTPTGNQVTGNGGILTLISGPLTTNATLTVRAIAPSACSDVTMNGSSTVTLFTPPSVFNVTPLSQTICTGGTVQLSLSGSQSGIKYQIYNGTTPSGAQVTGTGNAITLTSETLSSTSTLTVRAIDPNGCNNVAMNGSATITVNIPPTKFDLTPSSLTICKGGTAQLSLSGSQSGVQYQIYDGSTATGNSVTGTGNAITITSGNLNTSTTLTVQATAPTGCTNVTMAGSTVVTVNNPPNVFSITSGNKTICSGGTAQITISGSQSGIQYQIFNGSTPTGNPVNGTGNAITLNSAALSASTTLTVQAIALAGCSNVTMTGSAVITVNSPPIAYNVLTSNLTICSSSSATINIANSQSGVQYQIFNGSSPTGSAVLSSGGAINLISGPLTANTTLTVQAIAPGGCNNVTMNGSTAVTVNKPASLFNISPNNQTICSGSTAQLTLTGSQSGVQYQIFNGTTPTGNPVNGTGNSITLTSGSLSENTSLTVQAVGPTGCSNVTMSGTSIITVIKPVVPTISSTPASFCGSGSTVISVTNPQTNYTYQLFRNNSTTPEVTWGTYNGSGLLDFYVNLNQNASFTVKAFIGTCAVVTSNSVSLAVTNCAINYTVSPAYARSEYVFKEIIATPKLQNGKQYTFTGTNFLPGTSVDLTTGKIYVSDLSTLTSGTRTVNITATEAGTGIITEIPVTYSVSPDGNPTAATRFNPPVVLPVSLLYFKGTLQNGKVHLTWATATERNNQYFVVERSLDAITFNHIGQVEGAGNSNALLTYSFEDTYATTSAIYYRLKQVDFDGKFKYSQIIVLNSHGGAKVEKVFAYPNPTQKDVRIYVPEKLNFKTTIQIWDVAGQLIKTESRNDVAGRQYIDLDLQSFAVGTYIVSIQTGSENFILRIIRQ